MTSVDWFTVRQIRENPSLANPDGWFLAWMALSDDSLKDRLRRYYWLSTNAPNIYKAGFGLLVAEAERRGKPEIVEEAKAWVTRYGNHPATEMEFGHIGLGLVSPQISVSASEFRSIPHHGQNAI
jgi:hypothetical protein